MMSFNKKATLAGRERDATYGVLKKSETVHWGWGNCAFSKNLWFLKLFDLFCIFQLKNKIWQFLQLFLPIILSIYSHASTRFHLVITKALVAVTIWRVVLVPPQTVFVIPTKKQMLLFLGLSLPTIIFTTMPLVVEVTQRDVALLPLQTLLVMGFLSPMANNNDW